MTQNPAEHSSGQAAHQNRLTCGFVLFPSSANVEKTQYLFFTVTNTRKTRFPTSNTRHPPRNFSLVTARFSRWLHSPSTGTKPPRLQQTPASSAPALL